MAEISESPLDCLPLDALHRALGGRMVAFAGYAMPVHYPTGVMAEHLWTRASAGLFDVSHMGQLLVGGPGADLALETLLPGDIIGLQTGRQRYSLLLDDNGGILDDLMVCRRSDDLFLVVNGATKHDDLALLRAKLEPRGVAVDHRADWALLALQGPKAVDALARLAPGVAALSFMQAGGFTLAGAQSWISRSGYSGEDGFEISLPASAAEAVARALLDQPEVKPIGLGARDSLRLEAGLPLYGHDLGPDANPVEADLAFAISKRRKAEGGFPGAATIIDQLLNGVGRKRVGLKVEGRQPAREGALIYRGERQVGVVTSGGFSPSLNAPIAMGYVSRDSAQDGATLDIDIRGKRVAAIISPMPFVPHRYVRAVRA